MDSGMFLELQNAAIEALNNSDEWHENQNNIYQKRKELVCELFDYLDVKYDSNSIGMFLWGKVSNNLDKVEDLVDDILYKANVFITPGFIFGSNGNRYIRASLCANESSIKEAFKRIKNNI